MRKFIITLFIVTLSSITFSQTWVDIGIKGGYGLNYVVNSNLFNDKEVKYLLSPGYSFGAKAGFNFASTNQITFDVMSSSFQQNFSYKIPDTLNGTDNSYKKALSFNTIDFILLYRSNQNGSYFEIGPKYSKVVNKKTANTYFEANEGNAEENIRDSYYGLVLGFGAFVVGSENTSLTMGFRFSYGLNDIVTKEGKKTQYPATKLYDHYNSSHPFTAIFILELNHDLGYLAERSCTKKKKLLFF